MRPLVATAAVSLGLLWAAGTASAAPTPAPAWEVSSLATPTNFIRGDAITQYTYEARMMNIGAAPTDGSPIVITDTLPAGIEVAGEVKLPRRLLAPGSHFAKGIDIGAEVCETDTIGASEVVTCTIPSSLPGNTDNPALIEPLEELSVVVPVFTPESVDEGTTLTNTVEVEGGGTPAASASSENEASKDPAPRGFSYYHALVIGPDGQPATQAASHPYQWTTAFGLNTETSKGKGTAKAGVAGGDVKDIRVALPPGLVGNPTATALCSAEDFNNPINRRLDNTIANYTQPGCPDDTVIGVVAIRAAEGDSQFSQVPIYNLDPPPGMPAQLGFTYANIPSYVDSEVRAGSDYAIEGLLRNQSQAKRVTAAAVTIWGTPWADEHDRVRGSCLVPSPFRLSRLAFDSNCDGTVAAPARPFLRLPSSCGDPLAITMSFTNWSDPAAAAVAAQEPFGPPTGCNQVPFAPTLEARPTTDVADAPSGLNATVHIPQAANEDPEGLGQADLRDTVVTLPEGLLINPSSANGLGSCDGAQIGYLAGSSSPAQFTPGPAQCPDSSRIGTVEVDTPLIGHPLPGSVYVATPYDNPFDSLLAIYIAVHDPLSGIVVKLAGEVSADPSSGRLTTRFAETPETPFEDFHLDFFGGAGAALRTPATCGPYSTAATLTPWSAPESGPPATRSDSYEVAKATGGGECAGSAAALPFAPSFAATSLAPIAAAQTPAVIHLARADGSQELSALTLSPPPGLLARLGGIPACPEAALQAAAAKSGRAEQASPSCPADSRVGSVRVGAGAGPAPYFTEGSLYLAGPYKGAPLSFAAITPAAAGPYDLGTVVSRVAAHLDPESARITAIADPIPQILKGIPLDVRQIDVSLDRPGFTLNPTNCDPLAFTGTVSSVLGKSAALSDRYQLGECGALGFKPKLSLALKGATRRTGNPRLIADLTYPKGTYANISRAQVKLPKAAFLDNSHIRTLCTRVQFAAETCPAASVYGKATATSPLVDYTLSGPVYLRSSDNLLPDLVADLHGPASQPVRFALVGRTDSVGGALRNTFETVPDVPASHFHLELFGGKRGLVELSRNLCKGTYRAAVKLDAHNGKTHDTTPAIANSCKAKKGRRGR